MHDPAHSSPFLYPSFFFLFFPSHSTHLKCILSVLFLVGAVVATMAPPNILIPPAIEEAPSPATATATAAATATAVATPAAAAAATARAVPRKFTKCLGEGNHRSQLHTV